MPDVEKLRKKSNGANKDTKKNSQNEFNQNAEGGSNGETTGGRKLKDLPPSVYSAAPSLFAKDDNPEDQSEGSKNSRENADMSKAYGALKGAKVDKSGNVVSKSGTVLGQADGKLSKMVGKKVNWQGEIVDKKGKVLGTVSHITDSVSFGRTSLNALYESAKETSGVDGDKSIDKLARSAYKSAHGASKNFAKAAQSKKPTEKCLLDYGDMMLKMNTDSENVTFSFSLPQQQLKALHQQFETIVG